MEKELHKVKLFTKDTYISVSNPDIIVTGNICGQHYEAKFVGADVDVYDQMLKTSWQYNNCSQLIPNIGFIKCPMKFFESVKKNYELSQIYTGYIKYLS